MKLIPIWFLLWAWPLLVWESARAWYVDRELQETAKALAADPEIKRAIMERLGAGDSEPTEAVDCIELSTEPACTVPEWISVAEYGANMDAWDQFSHACLYVPRLFAPRTEIDIVHMCIKLSAQGRLIGKPKRPKRRRCPHTSKFERANM